MSLRIRYQLLPTRHPVLALAGRWVRPRPILTVTIIGPTDSRVEKALLDTGSDDTVFPETLAVDIGLDLAKAPVGSASGVGMVATPDAPAKTAVSKLAEEIGQARPRGGHRLQAAAALSDGTRNQD